MRGKVEGGKDGLMEATTRGAKDRRGEEGRRPKSREGGRRSTETEESSEIA